MAGYRGNVTPAAQEYFARSLYDAIWLKFGLVTSNSDLPTVAFDHDAPAGSINFFSCTEDIFRAVMCEQLLIRDSLKSYFSNRNSLIVANTDCVMAFCNGLCMYADEQWDFFKKLLRCSALIAEFFLYRGSLINDVQLYKVHKIWSTVFTTHFDRNFDRYGGWQGLNAYSDIYGDELYVPLERAVSEMMAPDEGVHPTCLQNLPNLEHPLTDATLVFLEMFTALSFVDMSRMPPESPRRSSSRNGRKRRSGRFISPIEAANEAMTQNMEQVVENPADPAVENPADPAVENPADPAVENPADPAVENPADPAVENPADPAVENPADPVVENPADPVDDATAPSKSPENESIEDEPPEGRDSRSRKRRSRVLEPSDDMKPPSPKQPKPGSSV